MLADRRSQGPGAPWSAYVVRFGELRQHVPLRPEQGFHPYRPGHNPVVENWIGGERGFARGWQAREGRVAPPWTCVRDLDAQRREDICLTEGRPGRVPPVAPDWILQDRRCRRDPVVIVDKGSRGE